MTWNKTLHSHEIDCKAENMHRRTIICSCRVGNRSKQKYCRSWRFKNVNSSFSSTLTSRSLQTKNECHNGSSIFCCVRPNIDHTFNTSFFPCWTCRKGSQTFCFDFFVKFDDTSNTEINLCQIISFVLFRVVSLSRTTRMLRRDRFFDWNVKKRVHGRDNGHDNDRYGSVEHIWTFRFQIVLLCDTNRINTVCKHFVVCPIVIVGILNQNEQMTLEVFQTCRLLVDAVFDTSHGLCLENSCRHASSMIIFLYFAKTHHRTRFDNDCEIKTIDLVRVFNKKCHVHSDFFGKISHSRCWFSTNVQR